MSSQESDTFFGSGTRNSIANITNTANNNDDNNSNSTVHSIKALSSILPNVNIRMSSNVNDVIDSDNNFIQTDNVDNMDVNINSNENILYQDYDFVGGPIAHFDLESDDKVSSIEDDKVITIATLVKKIHKFNKNVGKIHNSISLVKKDQDHLSDVVMPTLQEQFKQLKNSVSLAQTKILGQFDSLVYSIDNGDRFTIQKEEVRDLSVKCDSIFAYIEKVSLERDTDLVLLNSKLDNVLQDNKYLRDTNDKLRSLLSDKLPVITPTVSELHNNRILTDTQPLSSREERVNKDTISTPTNYLSDDTFNMQPSKIFGSDDDTNNIDMNRNISDIVSLDVINELNEIKKMIKNSNITSQYNKSGSSKPSHKGPPLPTKLDSLVWPGKIPEVFMVEDVIEKELAMLTRHKDPYPDPSLFVNHPTFKSFLYGLQLFHVTNQQHSCIIKLQHIFTKPTLTAIVNMLKSKDYQQYQNLTVNMLYMFSNKGRIISIFSTLLFRFAIVVQVLFYRVMHPYISKNHDVCMPKTDCVLLIPLKELLPT